MKFSLRAKIVAITVAILFLAMGTLTLISTRILTREYSRLLQTNGSIIGRNLKFQLDRLLKLGISLENLIGFEEQCESVVEKYKDISYAMVIKLDGEILFHSDPAQHGKKITEHTALEAIKGLEGSVLISLINGKEYQVISIPILSPHGEHIAAVGIGFPTELITQATAKLVNYSMVIAFISFSVAISLLVFGLSIWVTNPLMRLISAIQDISKKGLLTTRVKVNTQDEIGQLASTFNKMTEDLQKTTTSIENLNKEINERKKAEQRLQAAYKKLQETQDMLIQAEKLNAVGQLASGVAHEVRNPLGIIIQGVNYLEKKISPKEEDTFKILTIVKNSVKRADKIISSLFDFSKAAKLDLQPEDINSVLESSLSLIKTKINFKNIKLIKETKKDMPKALIDKSRIEQVFVNVFLNAIQAMPAGGKIIIRSFAKQLEELKNGIGRRSEDHFGPKEKAVIVEIEDTGKGISEEGLKKVFDPFFTTKGSTGGSGLGLSVSRNIIIMQKGLIDIKSQINKGTKVTVILKIARRG